jgi:adenylate cyclase
MTVPADAPRRSSFVEGGARSYAATVRELTDWLMREGRFLPDNGAILDELCERLTAAGVPLDRVSLHLRALHSQYRGVSRIWQQDAGVDERFLDHGLEKTATYLESPVRAVAQAHRRLDWRLDTPAALPFAMLEELREEGYVHYVITPVPFAAGMVNALSWATRRPGGFTAEHLQLLDELLPAYSVTAESKALFRFTETMLNTYVGKEPTQLILDGQVRRGDIRTITAALMLVDLRDFTLLSDSLPPRAVIRLLNDYFDCVFPAVQEHGGEVLEIMGDGVLAIFRQESAREADEACRAALAAAREALAAMAARNDRSVADAPQLHSGIALHYGTASYGNIGSGERLDFTVIGPDVNLVSRIEQFCRQLDRTLIMSEAFADQLGWPVWEIGHFELRGFAKLHRLFELPPEE